MKDGRVVATERVVRVSESRLEVRTPQGDLKGSLLRDAHGVVRWETPQGMTTGIVPAAL